MAERTDLEKTLTGDITRLIGHLDWALRWIDDAGEIPLAAEEPEDFACWEAAKAILAPPIAPDQQPPEREQ